MKIISLILLLLTGSSLKINAQSIKSQETINAEIKAMGAAFMDCLINKDSIKFFSLFNENPITFVRMVAPKEKADQNSSEYVTENEYFNDDYKVFYRNVSVQGYTEVKYDNLAIEQIDYMASLIFDYTFLKKGRKKCHGNQSIGLIFKNNSWLITRVIYTMEVESRYSGNKKSL